MFLLSSALKNEDFIFKKKENETNIIKKTPNELLCATENHENYNKILKELLLKQNKEENNIIDNNAYDDLELFRGIDKPTNSVISKIDKTKTLFGKMLLNINLNNPTTNIDILKKKQKIIKELIKDESKFKEIQNKLDLLTELQDTLLWTLKEKSIEEEKIFQTVYFNNQYLKPFNSNEEILYLYSLFKIVFAPIYGLLSPILFFIIPYLYLYFFTKIKFDFKVYFKVLKMSFFGGFDMMGNKGGMSKYLSMIFLNFEKVVFFITEVCG